MALHLCKRRLPRFPLARLLIKTRSHSAESGQTGVHHTPRPREYLPAPPFYRAVNQGTERLRDLSRPHSRSSNPGHLVPESMLSNQPGVDLMVRPPAPGLHGKGEANSDSVIGWSGLPWGAGESPCSHFLLPVWVPLSSLYLETQARRGPPGPLSTKPSWLTFTLNVPP